MCVFVVFSTIVAVPSHHLSLKRARYAITLSAEAVCRRGTAERELSALFRQKPPSATLKLLSPAISIVVIIVIIIVDVVVIVVVAVFYTKIFTQ